MIIPIQKCKGCRTIFTNEEELIKCPECDDKRIEIVLRAGKKTEAIIQIKRHLKGIEKAIEKLQKE
jgi:Zn finger protein HypA/HybF involved in hydrogenase expression